MSQLALLTQVSTNNTQILLNVGRCGLVYRKTADTSQLNYCRDTRIISTQLPFIVNGAVESVTSSTASNYIAGVNFIIPIVKFGNQVVSRNQNLSCDNISFVMADPSDSAYSYIYYQDAAFVGLTPIRINYTLAAFKTLVEAQTSNSTTATFGSCGNIQQPVTFTGAVSTDIYYFDVFNGSEWVPVSSVTSLSGSTTYTYNWASYPGQVYSGEPIRVRKYDGANDDILVESTFGCTGLSGSGSGSGSGECAVYPFFLGTGWNNTLNTLTWARTCVSGYLLQVSTNAAFSNFVLNEYLNETTTVLDLPAGTYYARVSNSQNNTTWSAMLTFTAS